MGDSEDLVSQDEIERLLRESTGQSPSSGEGSGVVPAQPANVTLSGGGGQQAPSAAAATAFPGRASPGSPADSDADKRLAQEDIEKLLGEAGKLSGPVPRQPPSKERPNPDPVLPGEGEVLPGDVELLLSQAERALASIDAPKSEGLPPHMTAFRLGEFSGAPASAENATLDLIREVELDLRIELGRTHMYLEDVLKLRRGSVVPLDKLAGDPVDIYVNGRLIARGEVLVLNDNFCVRIAELLAGAKPAA